MYKFTYHLVNIKQYTIFINWWSVAIFTYHLVNIKLNEIKIESNN